MFYISYKNPSWIKYETHLKELLSQLWVKYHYTKIHRLRIVSALDLLLVANPVSLESTAPHMDAIDNTPHMYCPQTMDKTRQDKTKTLYS